MTRHFFTSCLFLMFLCVSTTAQPGAPDLTFNATGNVLYGFDRGDDRAYAAVVRPDGKILTVGTALGLARDIALTQFNPDGTPDNNFGPNGLVRFGEPDDQVARGIALYSDGRYVITGVSSNGSGSSIFVRRFLDDGTDDTTFGNNGTVILNPGTTNIATSVALDSQERIIIAGSSVLPTSPNGSEFIFMALNPNGTLDTTFGNAGIVSFAGPFDAGTVNDVVIDTSDRIIGVGGTGSDLVVCRLTSTGSFDPSFDSDGIYSSSPGPEATLEAVTLDTFGPDLRIVATGHFIENSGRFALATLRLNSLGEPDATFGNNGLVTVDVAGSDNFGFGVIVQPTDGKIVVGGSAARPTPFGDLANMVAVRFEENGSRDATFGNNGVVETNLRLGDQQAFDLDWTPTGLILTGFSALGPANQLRGDFAFVKIAANGTLVTAFDRDGKLIVPWSEEPTISRAVAIQTDGKIVVASRFNVSFFISRLNADGSPDYSFGEFGIFRLSVGSSGDIRSLVIQPDGKIVACGAAFGDMYVLRLNPNGTLDSSFGPVGSGRTIDFGGMSDMAYDLVLDSSGRIVIVGTANIAPNVFNFGLARLLPNGEFDPTFGTNGVVSTDRGSNFETLRAVRLQPDGRIIAAGDTFLDFNNLQDFAVLRYNSNGTPDTTFNSNGFVRTQVGVSTDVANTLSLQSDGKIVVAGETTVPGLPNRTAVVRYLGTGALDSSFGTGGIVTTNVGGFSSGGFASAIRPDGSIFVGGYSENAPSQAYLVIRYDTNGTPGFADQLGMPWGTNGAAIVDVTPGADTLYDFAFDANGRLVAVGDANGSVGVLRLQGFVPTAAQVSVAGRVTTADGRGIANAIVWIQTADGTTRQARTSTFGFYQIDQLPAGKPAIAGVTSKSRSFETRVVELTDNATNVDFVALGTPADVRKK